MTANFRRSARQALTVARRDFVATVFTPTFLIFLLSPLLTIAFGAIGGLSASSMAKSQIDRERLVVIAPANLIPTIAAADRRLRFAFSRKNEPAPIRFESPAAHPADQARGFVTGRSGDVDAALYGPMTAPTVLYGDGGRTDADYLALLADETVQAQHLVPGAPVSQPVKTRVERTAVTSAGHNAAALFAVIAIFLFTLFLAGLTMGTMAEERSNKVIEVLAAAVPLESVFFGKLIGMFGVALLFVGFWATVASQVVGVLPPALASSLAGMVPAVGKPMFAALFLSYFIMSYLLIGSVYLILGAQASTQRELQMMALPMTIVQMAMVGLGTAAAGNPDSTIALIAEIFPFSSPMAMAARAANSPELWPHAVALLWQLLWVAVLITLGARWFRRGVLQSGGGRPRRRAQPASA